MISDVLGVSLRFPLESESAALGAAFQAGSAVSGLSIAEYINRQKIQIEDVIVTPSTNKATTEMYQKAYQRYIEFSRKLFATASELEYQYPVVVLNKLKSLASNFDLICRDILLEFDAPPPVEDLFQRVTNGDIMIIIIS